MVLTNERAEMLAMYLTDKKEAGFDLLGLVASEAIEKINADGFDFTTDEFIEFVNVVEQQPSSDGELDENTLDSVAGGISTGALITAFRCGYYIYLQSKKKRW